MEPLIPFIIRCAACGFIMQFDLARFSGLLRETKLYCPLCGKHEVLVGAVLDSLEQQRIARETTALGELAANVPPPTQAAQARCMRKRPTPRGAGSARKE